FFSSSRRHTRSTRDWSSDVCSSDLIPEGRLETGLANALHAQWRTSERSFFCGNLLCQGASEENGADRDGHERKVCHSPGRSQLRSEERRVGKESEKQGGATQQ